MQEDSVIDKKLAKKISTAVKKNFSNEQDFLAKIAETDSANPGDLEAETTGKEAYELEVARLIKKELKTSGITAEFIGKTKLRPNVVSVIGPARSRKNLVFNAHMDTLEPVGSFRGNPFTPFVRRNKMYGLGLLDAKAMVAAFVYAGKVLKDLKIQLSGKLMLQFVVDGVSGADSTLGTAYLLSKGVKAKAAVLGYAGDVVGIGHRGGYRFRITTKGEEIATASMAWQQKEMGKNAITEMVKVATELNGIELPFKPAKAFPGKKPVFTFPTLIQGGVGAKIVPDSCWAIGDVRLMPGNSDRQVKLRIKEQLKSLKGLQYKLEDLVYVPAVEIDQKEEIVQVVADETTTVLGSEPKVEGIGEWNSGFRFIAKDIPAVMQLPLKGGEYRGNHDYVELKSLQEVTEILVRVAISYLGIKS